MISDIISKTKCKLGLHSWGVDVWGIAVCENCGCMTKYVGWAGNQRKIHENECGILSDERALELYNYFKFTGDKWTISE